jgi:hypothetical protein
MSAPSATDLDVSVGNVDPEVMVTTSAGLFVVDSNGGARLDYLTPEQYFYYYSY